jgi:hypothetical protein
MKTKFQLLTTCGEEPRRIGGFVLLTNQTSPTALPDPGPSMLPILKNWPPSLDEWRRAVEKSSRPLDRFVPGLKIKVNDLMQTGYSYELVRPVGDLSDLGMRPHLTPAEMLAAGVFEGKYLNDCIAELPREWLLAARVSLRSPDPSINHYGAKSRSSLAEWRENGWIEDQDPRGWFQWYCRAWLGRRTPDDVRQAKRWKSFAPRHQAQIKAKAQKLGKEPGDPSVHPRQRQGLLQWAHKHDV